MCFDSRDEPVCSLFLLQIKNKEWEKAGNSELKSVKERDWTDITVKGHSSLDKRWHLMWSIYVCAAFFFLNGTLLLPYAWEQLSLAEASEGKALWV